MKKEYLYTRLGDAASFKEAKAGDLVSIQIMRTGKWNHPNYGPFQVTPNTLQQVVDNFKENVRGQDLPIDENHEPNHIALGRIRELELQDNNQKLFASIELTQLGAEKLGRGEYKYFSPEIVRKDTDNETGKPITNLLVGGAFTNRPYFKGMQALKYNEEVFDDDKDQEFYHFNEPTPMKKSKAILERLLASETMAQEDLDQIETVYSEENGEADPEVKGLYTQFNEKKANIAAKAKADADAVEAAKKAAPVEGKFTDPATGETVSFAEVVAMKDKLKTLEFAERKTKVTEEFSSFVFSETNKAGLVLDKSKDKMVNFAMTLDASQLVQFSDIMKGLTTEARTLFGETGDGGAGTAGDDRNAKVHAKALEIKETKQCSYSDAALEADKLIERD